jgi:hypothetical protein
VNAPGNMVDPVQPAAADPLVHRGRREAERAELRTGDGTSPSRRELGDRMVAPYS